MRKTKIVITMGPALLEAGRLREALEIADTVRLNASHGDLEDRLQALTAVRRTADEVGRRVAVLLDLQGPKWRVGVLDPPQQLAEGAVGGFYPAGGDAAGGSGLAWWVPLPHPELFQGARPGQRWLLDDGNLEVEVTESVLLESSGPALTTLKRMKALGITLALDDFGTGFSSLSYLHQYPFDIIKIDQSFIQSLSGESQGRSLAAAIIAMGKGLGLEVIAEGVEHREQASFLLACGCHKAQGFLFGAPMGPEAFLAFYREQVGGELREGLTRR